MSMNEKLLTAQNVIGLPFYEVDRLKECVDVYERNWHKNRIKNRYYEGKIRLGEVNLGIALPKSFGGLEIGCSWGAKTVDVLAARSMFDGFVAEDGSEMTEMVEIMKANNLIAEYDKTCRDELKLGCSFATLSKDDDIGCKIRFHSSQTAAAVWDGSLNRIAYGFAIIDTKQRSDSDFGWVATLINFYTENAIYVLRRDDNDIWRAEIHPHPLGRPMMVPFVWNPTSQKPFGQGRLKEPIRNLINGYVRTIANATIGLEFATSPQKYLLGVTDDQYDAVINQKFRQYIGNILASTNNPETGEKPTFGQLQQGNLQPHVEMIRLLATQFSAATGLSVTDTGIINDANPTSSDAILAQSQTLIALAEQLNTGNGDALRQVALMALAIANDTTLDGLTDEQKSVIPHFKNPAMPSVAATADAAVKIASVRPGFAQTDVFLEMMGYDQADIRRIKAQEQRERGQVALMELESTQRE